MENLRSDVRNSIRAEERTQDSGQSKDCDKKKMQRYIFLYSLTMWHILEKLNAALLVRLCKVL